MAAKETENQDISLVQDYIDNDINDDSPYKLAVEKVLNKINILEEKVQMYIDSTWILRGENLAISEKSEAMLKEAGISHIEMVLREYCDRIDRIIETVDDALGKLRI